MLKEDLAEAISEILSDHCCEYSTEAVYSIVDFLYENLDIDPDDEFYEEDDS